MCLLQSSQKRSYFLVRYHYLYPLYLGLETEVHRVLWKAEGWCYCSVYLFLAVLSSQGEETRLQSSSLAEITLWERVSSETQRFKHHCSTHISLALRETGHGHHHSVWSKQKVSNQRARELFHSMWQKLKLTKVKFRRGENKQMLLQLTKAIARGGCTQPEQHKGCSNNTESLNCTVTWTYTVLCLFGGDGRGSPQKMLSCYLQSHMEQH